MSGRHGYSWGALGSMRGMGEGGDTKRVAAVAGRQRRGWYRDGGGGGTERVAKVAREGGGSGT